MGKREVPEDHEKKNKRRWIIELKNCLLLLILASLKNECLLKLIAFN